MKQQSDIFDARMGSLDGAEVCELVRPYLLDQLKEKFPEIDCGIFRDESLGSQATLPGSTRDRLRKQQIIEDFKQNMLDSGISIYKPYLNRVRAHNSTP